MDSLHHPFDNANSFVLVTKVLNNGWIGTIYHRNSFYLLHSYNDVKGHFQHL